MKNNSGLEIKIHMTSLSYFDEIMPENKQDFLWLVLCNVEVDQQFVSAENVY